MILLNELTFWEVVTKTSPIIISVLALGTAISSYKNSTKSLRLSEEIKENYDVKKQFAKAQFETIREMMEELYGITLIIGQMMFNSERVVGGSMHTENFQEVTFTDSRMNPVYFHRQLSFDEEFFNEFKIYRYSNNIFIPKEIADELRKLWVMNTQRQPLENLERFHFVKLKKEADWDLSPEYIMKPFPDIGVYENLGSFLNQIVTVKSAVETWFSKYDIDDANLKI